MPIDSITPSPYSAITGEGCQSDEFPYAGQIWSQMFPSGAWSGNWFPYLESEHEVIEGWATELTGDEEEVVAAATSLLRDNMEFMRGLAGILGSGFITSPLVAALADSIDIAVQRVSGTFPEQPFGEREVRGVLDDELNKYGYVGPVVIAKMSESHPLYKLLWHEERDGSEASEVRKFMGRPSPPYAFAYPLNWTYAIDNGLAAGTDDIPAFTLPDAVRSEVRSIADSIALDGWWGRTGLTASGWLAGSLLGHPIFFTVTAFFKSELEDLSDRLDRAAHATHLNDSIAHLLRGAAGFWDTEDNPVAVMYDLIAGVWDTLAEVIEWLANDFISVSPPVALRRLPEYPEKNLLTNLTPAEMSALYATMHTGSTGRSLSDGWSGLEGLSSGGALSDLFDVATSVPTIHVAECMFDFQYTGFEQKYRGDEGLRRDLAPTVEFARVADFASLLLEQYICIDDAGIAISDILLTPSGMLGCLISEQVPSSSKCFADVFQGASLSRFIAILWRICLMDTFFFRMKTDETCLYPAFCWYDTDDKRTNVAAVVGPLRTDPTVTLTPLEQIVDGTFVTQSVFAQRFFVRGLLYQLFTDPAGFCQAWECLTCQQRAAVRQFFVDQQVHCACMGVASDSQGGGGDTDPPYDVAPRPEPWEPPGDPPTDPVDTDPPPLWEIE